MPPARPAALLALLVAAGPAAAVLPNRPAERAAVQKAAAFFQKGWSSGGAERELGAACLGGLALLEAEVKADDPAVRAVTTFVREAAVTETTTYRVALAVMYLDRLGEPADEPLIQVLGVRLYGGLNVAAGWTYATSDAVPPDEASRLRAALGTPGHKAGQLHPEAARLLQAVRSQIATTGRKGVGDDNSNTQFGLVGLWVAARRGVPADDAIYAIEARFLQAQSRLDGGWSYSSTGETRSTPAMTCAGLLALAAGAAQAGKPAVVKPRVRPAEGPLAGPAGDPFYNPHKTSPPAGPGAAPPPPPADEPPPPRAPPPSGVRDVAVRAALIALGQFVAVTPAGAGDSLASFTGAGNKFYLLWSVERAATAIGLSTLGGVDWYDWGSRHLLPAQADDGAFGRGDRFPAEVNTAFAVLFLCKTNLVGDLTGRIKGRVQDPKKAELRGGAGPGLYAPQRPEPARVPEPPPPEPTLPPGGLPQVVDLSPAVTATNRLTAAPDERWPDILAEAQNSKGVMQTLGLAGAIPRLEGWKQKQARDALAVRLARMTPATLRAYLRDQDPELRRAAALACGKKDDRGHVPDLIDRLTDPAEPVVRAARASLRSLTGQAFGPDAGASAEAKAEAAAAWKAWLDGQPR